MEFQDFQKKKLPGHPGVYYFLGKRKEILYIGKATSLRSRVRSYFDIDIHEKRSTLIANMVRDAKSIAWTETPSVLEALILEVNLIRTHKPRYNTISKDDKSFNHLIITDEEFPRVLVIRGKDIDYSKGNPRYTERNGNEVVCQYVFGPFPQGQLFREALQLVRKLFKFYDEKAKVTPKASRLAKGTLDFNRQIGLYPDGVTKAEYARTIRHIRYFFEGKKEAVIKDLERDMMRHAKREEFEQASILKKRVFALRHIQDVSLMKDDFRVHKDDKGIRIEAYDVAHMGGKDMVGVMTVVEGRETAPGDYRKFIIRDCEGSNDPKALREVLTRRFNHPEWKFPDLIVVDGSTAQKNAAERVLRQRDLLIPVVGVVKDEKHRPKRIIGPQKLIEEHERSIILANGESHRFAITFHRTKRKLVP
jgi:excinuclease UvrABC nuclease subunit